MVFSLVLEASWAKSVLCCIGWSFKELRTTVTSSGSSVFLTGSYPDDVIGLKMESMLSLLHPDGLRWRQYPFQMVARILALGSSSCLTKTPSILSLYSVRKPELHGKAPVDSSRIPPAQVFNMCMKKTPDDSSPEI